MYFSTTMFAKYETGSFSTVDPKLSRKTTTPNNNNRKIRPFVLSQVCLQENWLCSLVLTLFVVMKTRNEFSLHPRWGVREREAVFKLKFVTVGRTVALHTRGRWSCSSNRGTCRRSRAHRRSRCSPIPGTSHSCSRSTHGRTPSTAPERTWSSRR